MVQETVKDWAMKVSEKGIAISAILVFVLIGFGYVMYSDSVRDDAREKRIMRLVQQNQTDLMDKIVGMMTSIKENVNRNTSLLQVAKGRADDLVPIIHELMTEIRTARRELKESSGKKVKRR